MALAIINYGVRDNNKKNSVFEPVTAESYWNTNSSLDFENHLQRTFDGQEIYLFDGVIVRFTQCSPESGMDFVADVAQREKIEGLAKKLGFVKLELPQSQAQRYKVLEDNLAKLKKLYSD